MRHFGMGDPACPSQFIYGFPIVGHLSPSCLLPSNAKTECRPMGSSILLASKSERFNQMTKFTPTQASALWDEATDQVSRGRSGPSQALESRGNIIHCTGVPSNLVCRPPLFRSDVVRAIDDLKHGRVNERFVADSPIVLPSWGQVAGEILSINSSDRAGPFMIAYRYSPYKNLPTRPIDDRMCLIALFNPHDMRW